LAIFKLHSASKHFGKRKILNEVSFSFETGEIIGIFGGNGCGKSTLLKMLFGTMSADTIEMSVNGVSIKNFTTKHLSYLPQHPFIPKNIKVRDLIPIYFSEEKKQDAIFYDSMIANISSKSVGSLSLGQVRYLEVLLLANLDRPFLMLDEPFSMLDPLYKDRIKILLNKLKSSKGILITDHYFEDVLGVTDRNYLLKNGVLEKVLSKQSLKEMAYLGDSSI